MADLVINQDLPRDNADEPAMNQIVADPREVSRLDNPESRRSLRTLLFRYRAGDPTPSQDLPEPERNHQ